jgi:pSer/pThr/pTyr-binding forkhead associated (FHA) protein
MGQVTQPSMLLDRPMTMEIYTAICKSDRTPPSEPITVGRTAQSDVVVNDYSVSKDHAYFVINPQLRTIALHDRGSTNGTFVDGARIPQKSDFSVKSGQKIGFGRYKFLYLTARDFYIWLRRM